VQLELDDYVPPALYQAVAELLAWAYDVDEGMGRKKTEG
jgi:type III secretion system FlhB-like substrate exporter